MINTHWGGVTENNHFGTHEFLDLCEQLGCEPYICGNVGSGTVQEMQQWVEYITFDGISPMADLRGGRTAARSRGSCTYFGVGNENWGCGGNMTAEYYADQYRRYATYVRNFGEQPHLQDRLRPERRRLPLDRGADARGRPADGRPGAALLLRHRQEEPLGHRSSTEVDWFHQLQERAAHGRAGHQARRDHGQATIRRSGWR